MVIGHMSENTLFLVESDSNSTVESTLELISLLIKIAKQDLSLL